MAKRRAKKSEPEPEPTPEQLKAVGELTEMLESERALDRAVIAARMAATILDDAKLGPIADKCIPLARMVRPGGMQNVLLVDLLDRGFPKRWVMMAAVKSGMFDSGKAHRITANFNNRISETRAMLKAFHEENGTTTERLTQHCYSAEAQRVWMKQRFADLHAAMASGVSVDEWMQKQLAEAAGETN